MSITCPTRVEARGLHFPVGRASRFSKFLCDVLCGSTGYRHRMTREAFVAARLGRMRAVVCRAQGPWSETSDTTGKAIAVYLMSHTYNRNLEGQVKEQNAAAQE